ncbi:MAG: acyltransferase domain-containing protein, partial [Nitrospinota bacterium]
MPSWKSTSEFSSLLHRWETEVFLIQGDSRQDVLKAGEQVLQFLSCRPTVEPKDLAYTLNCPLQSRYRLAVVASSLQELAEKLAYGLKRLADPHCLRIKDRSGIFFSVHPLSQEGSLAFLFPGEGAQYVNMLSDLCCHFPEVRGCFDQADRIFLESNRGFLPSQVLFPPPLSSPEDLHSDQKLWQTALAAEVVFAADYALFKLLTRLEILPQAVVGHSSGELAALLAAGAVEVRDEGELIRHGLVLNNICASMIDQIPPATLMAVGAADPAAVTSIIAESKGALSITMDNCPHQIVLCGSESAITQARDRLQGQGAICNLLPFNRPYHTPLFRPVCDQLIHAFRHLKIVSPRIALYSCLTTQPYPQDPDEIRALAVEQWAQPVRFRETIEAMYDAGVRIFVEVGPRGNLTNFVDDILQGRPYLAVPSNVTHRSGITQLNYLIGLLAAHGVSMRLDYLYAHRAPQRLSLEETGTEKRESDTMRLALELPQIRLRKEVALSPHSSPSRTDLPKSSPRLGMPVPQESTARKTPPQQAVTPGQFSPVRGKSDHTPSPLFEAKTPVSPAPPPAASPGQGSRSRVMTAYLQTMNRFLSIQQETMQAFMAQARHGGFKASGEAGKVAQESPTEGSSRYSPSAGSPFSLTVTSLIPGEEVIATCQFDLEEHLFLRHHTIGKHPPTCTRSLPALPVVPLTISVEIMAQVASLLFPGKRLLTVQKVRAYRWIAIEGQRRTVLLKAKRKEGEQGDAVGVKILDLSAGEKKGLSSDRPFIEGIVAFGDAHLPPPETEPFTLRGEHPYRFTPEQYYREV